MGRWEIPLQSCFGSKQPLLSSIEESSKTATTAWSNGFLTSSAIASRAVRARVLCISIAVPFFAVAASPDESVFGYVQYGQWDSARQGSVGLEAPLPFQFQGDSWTTFWQAEAAEWYTRKPGRQFTPSTELAVGPMGRYYFDAPHDYFTQAIVNISFVVPRYWRDSEREGTAFNFGGGFAFGYRLGPSKSTEISLGAEHFSNGGLRDPNPGRNFFQVRYAMAF